MKIPFIALSLLWATPAFSDNCQDYARSLFSEKAFLQQVNLYPLLPKKEQHELFVEYAQTGDEEKERKLMLHNLRFVLKVANKYRHYSNKEHFIDIIQEGTIGLLEAIREYDPHKGFEFATLANYHVEGRIKDYNNNRLRSVRVKIHLPEQKRFAEIKEELSAKGKSVYNERKRIAKELGLSVEAVMIMDSQLGKINETGLDEPTKGGMALADILPAQRTSPNTSIVKHDPIFRKHLIKFLKKYPKKKRDIFLQRVFSPDPPKLRELAHLYGHSKQNIQRIEKSMTDDFIDYMGQFAR